MMRVITILILSFCVTAVFALEVDEKLTSRVLSLSTSKKTLLINRGTEDGVVVGNHAKFFLTTGVVARAVVVKSSPSRSVWAVYKLVDPEQIKKDAVINFKIVTPVDLTDDPSKSIAYEPADIGANEGAIPVAEGGDLEEEELAAESTKSAQTSNDKKEMESLQEREILGFKRRSLPSDKVWQVGVNSSLNWLASTVTPGVGNSVTDSSASYDFGLQAERYFSSEKSVLHKLSIGLAMRMAQTALTTASQVATGATIFSYGGTLAWHLYSPFLLNKFNWFVEGGLGFGSTSEYTKITASNSEVTLAGSLSYFSGGVGAKYYFANGFGLKAQLDYYQESTSFAVANASTNTTKTSAGPRFYYGGIFRF